MKIPDKKHPIVIEEEWMEFNRHSGFTGTKGEISSSDRALAEGGEQMPIIVNRNRY